MSKDFIYKFSRYHVRGEDEYESLEEAKERARIDHETGEAYPIEITDKEGRVVLRHEQLLENF